MPVFLIRMEVMSVKSERCRKKKIKTLETSKVDIAILVVTAHQLFITVL